MIELKIDLTNMPVHEKFEWCMGGRRKDGEHIGFNSFHFIFNGQPWLPVMGEFHYSRYPDELWDDELRKIKAGGVDILPSYVFWNHHEEEEGVFEWSGRKNVRKFVELCKKHDLWVLMRIGPFCHGEVRNGGLPDWLYGMGCKSRCNDPRYLLYVKRFYGEFANQLRGLMFKDGGPIIGMQYENEFMDSVAPWETTHNTAMCYTPKGNDGTKHLKKLKSIAKDAGLDTPLHVCTGWGTSPIDTDEFLPMFGGYGYYAWSDDPVTQEPTSFFLFNDMRNRQSDKFDPRKVPYACCEIGGGMQAFYRNRPVVPPESVEAMHVAQLGSGSNLMGYYVYHGGINPVGKHSYLNEYRCPRITYDFQAPLGEFGQTRPHYGMLRRQFIFLKSFGSQLAPMTVSLTPASAECNPADTETIRWAVRSSGNSGYLFLNNFQDHVDMPERKGVKFTVKTPDGNSILFPNTDSGLNIGKYTACILPFNFNMDGLHLKSATVQPLTKIKYDDVIHYFFFALDGMKSEYVFSASSYESLKVNHAKIYKKDDIVIIDAVPGTSNLLTFKLKNGVEVRVTTLSDKQAREFSLAETGSRQHVFLSSSQLFITNNEIEMRNIGARKMDFAVYPPLKKVIDYISDGIFQRCSVQVPQKQVKLSVRKIDDSKVAINIPADALVGINELFLQVDYIGDTGSSYLNGKLIHDNFWNGGKWEIAMRPFMPEILQNELVLVLTPLRAGNGAKVEYTSMAAMKLEDENNTMQFKSIRAIVEYQVKLKI